MKNHCLKAILHNGVNSWTFRFYQGIDSPPENTYEDKPNKLVLVPSTFHYDTVMLNTYKSGAFHALYQIKLYAISQMRMKVGLHALKFYRKDSFKVLISKDERIVSACVTVCEEKRHTLSI